MTDILGVYGRHETEKYNKAKQVECFAPQLFPPTMASPALYKRCERGSVLDWQAHRRGILVLCHSFSGQHGCKRGSTAICIYNPVGLLIIGSSMGDGVWRREDEDSVARHNMLHC